MKHRILMSNLCPEPVKGMICQFKIIVFTDLETDHFTGDGIPDSGAVSTFIITKVQICDDSSPTVSEPPVDWHLPSVPDR